ncbi:MAG: hypothetical protein J6K47_00335 [Clostridia bacterium]|nr:hypothetical protein [Clostridia bacterium]
MKKRLLTILLSLVAATCLTFALTACGEKKTECEKNGHSFATEWLNDATDHWHKCANCNEVSDKAAHVYDNDVDATCNTCGYERAAHTAHTAGTVWENDETNHWHVCTASGCEEKLDTAAHTWNAGEITTPATFTSDGVKTYTCTVCEKAKTETVTMEYIDVNFVKSDAEVQTKVRFTVAEAGTYYFRYEVQDCGFANGYYWINMNKVDGTLQQTDTNHAQAKIYGANKQLVKEGLQTQAAGQFMAVSDEDAQTRKGLMDNGVKYLEMPFVTPGEYEMIVTHFAEINFTALDYSDGSFSKTNVTLWDNSYKYYSITLTDEMLAGGYYGTDLQLDASPATGLIWQFVDADGNPVEKKEGDTDTYYSTPAAGTYYIVIYSATKQTGVTVSASLC